MKHGCLKIYNDQYSIFRERNNTLKYQYEPSVLYACWMSEAKFEKKKWANRIETALNLRSKTYLPLKLRKW